MGNRLSKIYTKTGDDGTTGLGDGTRVPKTNERIEAFGTVDEANSALALVLATPNLPADITGLLTSIQHELFDLGGELAVPGYRAIDAEHVARLERELDRLNEPLPPLKEFILPGGGPASAACHLTRAIVRRAERCAWRVKASEPIAEELLQYLNRLSDLLFVVARVLARHENGAEVLWRHDRR